MIARDYQLLLLSSFMANRRAFKQLAPQLSNESFTEPDLRAMYDGMVETGDQFTVTELAEACNAHGGMALVRDVRTTLQRFEQEIPTVKQTAKWAAAVDKLGRIIQLRALFTAALKTFGDVPNGAMDEAQTKHLLKLDDDEYVGKLMSKLVETQYENKRDAQGYRPFDYYLVLYKDKLRRMLKGEIDEDRLATGWGTFNQATGGGLPKGLVVLAGLPGSGKTQWLLQLLVDVAATIRDTGGSGVCAMNSLEMPGIQLIGRTILSEAGLDSAALRTGEYNSDKDALLRLAKALRRQEGLPLVIDDSSGLTSSTISTRVGGLLGKYSDVVLLGLDFAELMGGKEQNQEQKVANVFINCKAIAKRYNSTVVLVSHLNRQTEMTGSKIPGMNNIRYSRMAEATADLIDLVYNPQYYLDQGIKLVDSKSMPPKEGVAYHIIAKHRDGPTGFMALGWDAPTTRWHDRTGRVHTSTDGVKQKKEKRNAV